MASYVKFQDFSEQLCKGVHQFHAAGHTIKIYLSNAAPNVATHTVKADIAEITVANGYNNVDIQNDLTETSGTATVSVVDPTPWTASGGSFGPFRYVIAYNDTPTSPADPLISYWDYGSAITINTGESFSVDHSSNTLFTLA